MDILYVRKMPLFQHVQHHRGNSSVAVTEQIVQAAPVFPRGALRPPAGVYESLYAWLTHRDTAFQSLPVVQLLFAGSDRGVDLDLPAPWEAISGIRDQIAIGQRRALLDYFFFINNSQTHNVAETQAVGIVRAISANNHGV